MTFAPPDRKIRLLFVDGQPDRVSAFRAYLGEAGQRGFEVEVAQRPEEALPLIATQSWDAVVLDFDLGLERVIETLHAIRDRSLAPPVIVTGKRVEPELEEACRQAGAADYLCRDELNPAFLERSLRYAIRQAETVDKLEEALRVRDHFLSLLAHDIRGPLGVLASGLEMYADRCRHLPPEKLETFLRRAEDQARTLLDLSTRMLDWVRSQSADFRPHKTIFSLPESIEHVVGGFRAFAENKAVRLVPQLTESALIEFDRNMLESVLRNVLGNAIKFSHPGGEVRVVAERVTEGIQIAVIDQGIGMSREQCERLAAGQEIEVRHGTRNEKGAGLGLQLSQRFIRLHGGSVDVESAPGEGTRVVIHLPEACRAAPAAVN